MTNVQENGKTTIRLPRLIAQDKCVERCNGLREKIGHALGESTLEAVTALPAQRVIVCDKASRFICHAQIYTDGYIQSDITRGGADILYPTPACNGPEDAINAALQNGAKEQPITKPFER